MTIQLVGAGLGRTGTMSLKLALERLLGGTCHHMMEVSGTPTRCRSGMPPCAASRSTSRVCSPTTRRSSTTRAPRSGASSAAAFPDAPVLLSTRSSAEAWWESASNTILVRRNPPTRSPDDRGRWSTRCSLRSLGGDIDSTDGHAVMAAYEAHNAAVAQRDPRRAALRVPARRRVGPAVRSARLPEPDEPFPHTNTREEFRARAGFDDLRRFGTHADAAPSST